MRGPNRHSRLAAIVARVLVSAGQGVNRLDAYVRLMRPHQWSKNAVVLAGVVFSGQATEPAQLVRAIAAVIAFCLVSSAMYVFNDWHDRAEDRLHPTKCFRPIACREVQPSTALYLSCALLVVSLAVAAPIAPALPAVILVYAILMVAYTIWFRRLAVVDVLSIAAGFVLRAAGGAVAVATPISIWLFVCTLSL